jgi:4-hydroxybenzoate polyprenyltransferase
MHLPRELVEFARTIRLGHTLFAMPFALGAAFLAEPPCPRPAALALLVACLVAARTAAMGMNRVADARLDAANPRTADWAIPAGRLRRGTALAFTLASAAAFLALAWGFLWLRKNPWPGFLAPAFLAVLLGYAYTKRFTVLSHWVLGLALGLAPVGAWIALRGGLALGPALVGAAVVFWTAGFDILYALADEAFDREASLRSVPALVGRPHALRVALGSHLVMLFLLAAAYGAMGPRADQPRMGPASLAALAAVAVLVGVQHAAARRMRPEKIASAFFPFNAAISIVWMAGAVADAVASGIRAAGGSPP